MTNKEWLEEAKKHDEQNKENFNYPEYRKTKALEIIASELIKLNEERKKEKKYGK